MTERSETSALGGDQVFADFALDRKQQPRVNENFNHASDQFGPQALTNSHEHRALDRSERAFSMCIVSSEPMFEVHTT